MGGRKRGFENFTPDPATCQCVQQHNLAEEAAMANSQGTSPPQMGGRGFSSPSRAGMLARGFNDYSAVCTCPQITARYIHEQLNPNAKRGLISYGGCNCPAVRRYLESQGLEEEEVVRRGLSGFGCPGEMSNNAGGGG